MKESSDPDTDALLRRAGQGDEHARAELLDRYRERLRRMVDVRLDRRVAARADASDIVQETLHDAHRRLGEYFANPQLPFYPWLRRIAADRLADAHRRHIGAERRSVLKEHPWLLEVNDESLAELAHDVVTSSIIPSHQAILAEMEARMQAALIELRPHDREILVLRYLERLGVTEIAGVLGISQTAVTSRHLRALQRLRRLMGDEFGV